MRLIDADKLRHELIMGHDLVGAKYTDMTDTVKAIPIELIKKEMKRRDEDIKWAWSYGNAALDKMEYLKTWLTIKLEDWEKENADL